MFRKLRDAVRDDGTPAGSTGESNPVLHKRYEAVVADLIRIIQVYTTIHILMCISIVIVINTIIATYHHYYDYNSLLSSSFSLFSLS
jgi:hypothetical protein